MSVFHSARAFCSCLTYGLFALTLVAMVGCGSTTPVAHVDGHVTVAGEPITAGDVNFFSTDKGVGAKAALDGAGGFKVENLVPGDYAVYVTPPIQAPPPPGTAVTPVESKIPMKARDMKTSDVKLSLKGGKNTDVKIELKQ